MLFVDVCEEPEPSGNLNFFLKWLDMHNTTCTAIENSGHLLNQDSDTLLGVRVFDTSRISTKTLILTLRNCGLNKRMHFKSHLCRTDKEVKMSTNHLVKERLRHLIQGNLDLLCQHLTGTIAQQWSGVLLLLQFIEYLLKYRIQGYPKGFGTSRPRHNLKKLYGLLADDDRESIEKRFSQLMAQNERRDPKSFDTIKVFVEDYHNSYDLFRYDLLEESANPAPPYFYVVDTFLVLIALMKCSDIDFDVSKAYNRIKGMKEQIDKKGIGQPLTSSIFRRSQ